MDRRRVYVVRDVVRIEIDDELRAHQPHARGADDLSGREFIEITCAGGAPGRPWDVQRAVCLVVLSYSGGQQLRNWEE